MQEAGLAKLIGETHFAAQQAHFIRVVEPHFSVINPDVQGCGVDEQVAGYQVAYQGVLLRKLSQLRNDLASRGGGAPFRGPDLNSRGRPPARSTPERPSAS